MERLTWLARWVVGMTPQQLEQERAQWTGEAWRAQRVEHRTWLKGQGVQILPR